MERSLQPLEMIETHILYAVERIDGTWELGLSGWNNHS